MDPNRPWYQDDAFWDTFGPYLFTEERFEKASADCDRALALAEPAEGGRVCDLCCGPGRHSLELARRGFQVTGVDRTAAFLAQARQAGERQRLSVEWVQEDMYAFSRPGAFDLALNLYTSFGYALDAQADQRALRQIHASLRPGGALVMEMMGREILARIFRERDWHRAHDGALFLEERRLGEAWASVELRWILVKDGRVAEHDFVLPLFSGSQLAGMLREAGFERVSVYGSLLGDPYDQKAKRLVVVARR